VNALYPNTGTTFLANLFSAAMADCVVHLFNGSTRFNAATTLGNLTEAFFSGYAPITVANLLPPYLAPQGGTNTQIPTIQFAWYNPSSVDAVNVTAAGTGYTTPPTIGFTGGGGSGATAHATVSGGNITAITVDTGGSGYTSAPTVTITGGGGSGGTATATIANTGQGVNGISVTAGGSGYTTPPTVTFSGGGGTGAVATAAVSGGVVTGITIVNPGTGYTSAPTVGFTGGGGSGATATATIGQVGDLVQGFFVTDPTGNLVFGANFDAPIGVGGPGAAIPLDVTFNFKN